jgi:hypothetical protein
MAQANYVTSAIGGLKVGASAKPSTNPIRAAHAKFIATLAGVLRAQSPSMWTPATSRTAPLT